LDWLLRLLEAGFRQVGHWELSGKRPVYSLHSHAGSSDVLYSFVVDGVVMYVGKTTMPLSRRMYDYQNPGPSQRTNMANHAHVLMALELGKRVEIYALAEDDAVVHHGFRVSLAAGLEDDLIHQVNPPWNKTGS
jgi:hypothetical protein